VTYPGMSQQIHSVTSTLPTLDDEQFVRWQTLLEERTGMSMPEQRRSFLQTSLGLRMKEIGCESYSSYFDKVVSGPSGAIEWNTLVDRLTVQETRFFRDRDAFAFVEKHCNQVSRGLPESKPLEIWSLGCSSGEETYSLAMVANQAVDAGKTYAVTGTDISTFVLRKARSAEYARNALDWIPEPYRKKGVELTSSGRFQIKENIQQRCCFTQVNILNLSAFPLQSQHLIFCQNVLIYFRRWRRREILNLLVERLAPGGILVIGSGEIVDWRNRLVQPCQNGKVTAFIRKQLDTTRETEWR